MSSVAAVARIAYLASEVIVDSQPKSNVQQSFFSEYITLDRKAIRRPKLVSVPNAADPASYILHHKSSIKNLSESFSILKRPFLIISYPLGST